MNHPPARGRAPSRTASPLRNSCTEIELIWIEKRLEHWIRFGRPDAIIALVRWSANDFGTIHSRIDILRAVRSSEPYTTVPFVRPGGELLLSIQGWPKVRKVLEVIDRIEAEDLDSCDVAPEHWRHVHNRLSAGEPVRAYTAERHRAWLKRKALGQ